MIDSDRPQYRNDEIDSLLSAALAEAWRTVPERDAGTVAAQRRAFAAGGARLRRRHTVAAAADLSRQLLRYAAILLFALSGAFVGGRAVSAQSLPGDELYPIKLALESADGLFYPGDSWQSEQEERRVAEIRRLAASGTSATVNFVASPLRTAVGGWIVNSVPLMVSPEQDAMLASRCANRDGSVRIYGEVRDGRIYATAVTPSCLYVAAR